MPIKPENKARYPANWQEIRAAILERAEDRCEWCGIPNRELGAWDRAGTWHPLDEESDWWERAEGGLSRKAVEVVLTIMHLDHTPEHNDHGNLKAACQRCHNRYDQSHRQANAATTRREKRERGQEVMALESEAA